MTQDKNLPEFEQGSVKKATQGISSADLWKCPVDRLTVAEGFNVRDKDDAYWQRVEAIKHSIIENGYMADKPIAGYVANDGEADIIIITDGHTRYDAVLKAREEGHEINEVPVVTKPRGTSMEDLTIALVTSNSGEKLKPLEVAKVCKRLIGYGMDENEIARRLGYTRAYVLQMLDLLAAPKAVRDMVSSGKVSATLASQTIKKHGKQAAKVLSDGVKTAEAKGKSKVTAKHVKPKKEAVRAAPAPAVSTDNGDILQRSVEWMRKHSLTEDMNILMLVAHLIGEPVATVEAQVRESVPATTSPVQPDLPPETADEEL
jgi:ParB family chromosome partitioning protein